MPSAATRDATKGTRDVVTAGKLHVPGPARYESGANDYRAGVTRDGGAAIPTGVPGPSRDSGDPWSPSCHP